MKRYVTFCIFIIIICITYSVNAKYVIEYQNKVATINIDRKLPKIEVIKIESFVDDDDLSNTIKVNIKVMEENIIKNNLNIDTIKILKDGNKIILDKMRIEEKSRNKKYIEYDIILEDIMLDGYITLEIPKGVIIDKGYNKNEEIIIDINV